MLFRSGLLFSQIGLMLFVFMMAFRILRSDFAKRVTAIPFRPILAVRPVRWV